MDWQTPCGRNRLALFSSLPVVPLNHAAIYAKYLFSGINKITVGLTMPSLFTLYQQTPILDECLVIGISQSGQTPDVRAVLEEAQRQGMPTISISNAKDAPIASIADYNIILEAN